MSDVFYFALIDHFQGFAVNMLNYENSDILLIKLHMHLDDFEVSECSTCTD